MSPQFALARIMLALSMARTPNSLMGHGVTEVTVSPPTLKKFHSRSLPFLHSSPSFELLWCCA